MHDTNWEGVGGEAAKAIEYLNYATQLNIVEALFRLFTHKYGNGPNGCSQPLTGEILRELHRAGTLFLLPRPGEYRDVFVTVMSASGTVVYEPPPPYEVPRLVDEFEAAINDRWLRMAPIELASFALWRINWIHPFKNGNGRSARAFAYACLCLRHGYMLPGEVTVVDMLMADPTEYRAHLGWADKTFAESGEADLSPMSSLLDRLLTEQLSSVRASLGDEVTEGP